MSHLPQADLPDLRDHALARVLPFWAAHGVDHDYGGYLTDLDCDGSLGQATEKHLVAQTRLVYSFAAGAAAGGPSEWLNLARQGAAFILRHFRDVQHDGWFWSVSRAGQPRETAKRTYGHAFVIYSLAEYARLCGDSRALAAAAHTWSLVTAHLWDEEHGGAIEACDRAWRVTDPGHTMGTHLHLLEALLSLNEAAGADRYWPRVCEVCELIVTHMIEPQHRCALEKFCPDWRHHEALSHDLVDYGHNLEAAWLLLRVCQIEDEPRYREAARGFLDYVLRFGLDRDHGGVFSHGPLGEPASVRHKIWWVQTEALVGFLLGRLVLGDDRCWEAFLNVARFALENLHDPEHGEWYHSTQEDGTPRDRTKGSAWKAAYHITQACLHAQGYLAQLAAGAG